MFKVELSREAQRFFERCDDANAKKLAWCFQALEQDPRVGELRVVYTIDDPGETVFVITIAKRSDVYG